MDSLAIRFGSRVGGAAPGSGGACGQRRPGSSVPGSKGGRLPTFLVIGAARSGTTTLHYLLGQHPEIFVSPIKETNFFLVDEAGELPPWVDEATRRRTPKTLEEYAALFRHATDQHRAVGESSPGYLHGPVARRIKRQLPDAKLVAILRHPVEQALSIFSTWQGGHLLKGGRTVDRFLEALASPNPGPEGALPLAEHGQFHRHIEPYFELFARSQIEVVLLDQLERDDASVFAKLFGFLGVDAGFRLEQVERYNETGTARSALIHRTLSGSAGLKQMARSYLPEAVVRRLSAWQHRLRSANLRRNAILSPRLRRELTERYYAADLEALEKLIRRDLGPWLGRPPVGRTPAPRSSGPPEFALDASQVDVE